jgi:hypothetical protein
MLAAAVMVHAAHAAEPDFSRSTATFEPMPAVAGDVVSYRVTVANTGADSTYTRIVSPLPHGYLVGADGDCTAAGVTDDRLVWHEGRFAAGTSKECRIDILTRPDSAGTIATLATEITTPPSGYLRFEARPTLESRPNPNVIPLGPVGITPAGIVTLALLAVGIIGAVIIGKWRGGAVKWRLGAWIAVVASVGFLLLFVDLARGDLRSHTDYRETSCLIVDSSIRSFQGSGKKPSSTYAPEFAVRYDALGTPTYSVASPPATAVSIGVIRSSRQTIERLTVGSSQPCWFDPDDVKTVLLERGPGAAYIFAVLPLSMLALGIWMLTGARRTRTPGP